MGSASTLNQLTDAKSRFKDYSNAKSAIKMEAGKKVVQNTSGHQTEEKVKVKIALDRLHESGEAKEVVSSHRIDIDNAALKTSTLDDKKNSSVARRLDLKLVGSSQFMI